MQQLQNPKVGRSSPEVVARFTQILSLFDQPKGIMQLSARQHLYQQMRLSVTISASDNVTPLSELVHTLGVVCRARNPEGEMWYLALKVAEK